MLILYSTTLLYLLINSNSLGVESLGSFIYKSIGSANKNRFIYFFLSNAEYMFLFYSFSCLIVLARTFSNVEQGC